MDLYFDIKVERTQESWVKDQWGDIYETALGQIQILTFALALQKMDCLFSPMSKFFAAL